MKKTTTALLLAIFATSLTQAAIREPWTDRATVDYASGNLAVSILWSPRAGLQLGLAQKGSDRKVMIEASAKRTSVRLLPEGDYPAALADGAEFFPAAMPVGSNRIVTLLVKVRPDAWSLYLDRHLVAVLPAPFLPPLVVSHPTADLPSAEATAVSFQKVGRFRFEDRFLVPEDDKNKLAAWEIRSGAWTLHTAADNTLAGLTAQERSGKQQATPDRSPNYYSLQGTGTNAVILSGYEFYDGYHAEAAVRVAPGEAGVLFYASEGRAFGFTATQTGDSPEALLALWHASTNDYAARTTLAAVRATLGAGQWCKLRVRTFPGRVECWVDGTRMIDRPLDLPPGGQFGLYASGDGQARFDDVLVVSRPDAEYRNLPELKRAALAESGVFFSGTARGGILGRAAAQLELAPEESDRPQHLVLGPAGADGHVFSAVFEPQGRNGLFGLITGFRDAAQPYYRFTRHESRYDEVFLLERVVTNVATVIEELRLPLAPGRKPRPAATLLADGSSDRELRLYRDGQLVLVHEGADACAGASGLYVGPRTTVRILRPCRQAERRDVYRNQFEKNRLFVEDPFMRHWSSPEGQWLEQKDGTAWHKGDFFGRFLVRLPVVTNGQVHVGVEEGTTNGALVVRVDTNTVQVCALDGITGQEETLATIAVADLASVATNTPEAETARRWFTLEGEDYWFWVTSGDRVHAKCRLEKPLHGRRSFLRGYTADQLKHSYVERYNVKDCLFSESLHEWTINGGRWEVVSRFQCMPAWSFMNGESADGMAALWSKYEFFGDFCVEMFAGIRHGWYARCGDLNLTAMGRDNSPSLGYTAVCTGWDPDHSQLHSRLFRNGAEIAESDKYLVPRFREGNRRLYADPLVRAGRDVHGAWYYIKLRRVGKMLEYYFDNELVFSVPERDPLPGGTVGIWTFLNSMMVARVKIAADEIRPRQLAFEPVDPATLRPRSAASPADAPPPVPALADGRPSRWLQPGAWSADDPVGAMQVRWQEDPDGSTWLATRNMLGSGALLARCNLPPQPYPAVAGWEFRLQRTPDAQFNFHYSIGRLDPAGKYVPSQEFFHRLSGTAFGKGKWKRQGETDVPPTASTNAAWYADGAWTTVRVWAAADAPYIASADSNLLVRVEGFGNLQPCDELQGLTGNAPGAGYAVRDFAAIGFAPPVLNLATAAAAGCAFSVVETGTGRNLAAAVDLATAQRAIDGLSATGLVSVCLTAQRGGRRTRVCLPWLRLPPEPAVTCAVDDAHSDALVLETATPYPDRRFLGASLALQGQPATAWTEGLRRRVVPLPRDDAFARSAARTLRVEMRTAAQTRTFDVPWQGRPDHEPPVLLRLEGLGPLCDNFELRSLGLPLSADPNRMRLGYFDPRQGSFLTVANAGSAERLRAAFEAPLNLASFPLLQFRYRAAGMAFVSLSLDEQWSAKFSEEFDAARPVRYTNGLALDGAWHTWRGMLSDAVGESPFQAGALSAQRLQFGSRHAIDQTGLFSTWDVDDVVAGPAVSRKEPLAFTPYFFDYDGVTAVAYALHAGPAAWDDLPPAEAAAVRWVPAANRQAVTPELGALADGVHHLFLRARDAAGNTSHVTDVPFLLDTTPPRCSYAYEPTTDPAGNASRLRLLFVTDGGASMDLKSLSVRWSTNAVEVPSLGSTHRHGADTDTVLLNWPLVFRDYLDRSVDGQTGTIVVASARDGAGNAGPDVTVPCVIRYASDTNPPTLLRNRFPSNVLFSTSWELASDIAQELRVTGEGRVRSLREPSGEPYIRIDSSGDSAQAAHRFENVKWELSRYPYLAFRIRRPTYSAGEKTELALGFELDGRTAYALPLTPVEKKDALKLPTPVAWASNQWVALTLDLRRLLDGKVPADALAKGRVTSFTFKLTEAKSGTAFDLQSVFVLGPWGPDDAVVLNAFDASGIAGVSWGTDAVLHTQAVCVAALAGLDRSSGWAVLKVRDRAGNSSLPLRVPIPAFR